ncbi:hypothetical protein HNY73_009966 [Argiope bruennichi]|uniref:Uncharacterized protein n=1 Tax=Argiope bruennichi TaxID=94029 RepID=A0A8T0F1A7_ARGBR|nr:hypothetical protein HNY73_009966 [Argiope bruennichi]
MDDVKEFYITLPSDSSMNYFPSNKQSSYRTKLSAPLVLLGDWEVALSEVCIPRNWFNIGDHNNFYTVMYEKEDVVVTDKFEQQIKVIYKSENVDGFWLALNRKIVDVVGESKINFEYDSRAATVTAHIREGVELQILKESKLLYMLHMPNEDTILSSSSNYRFRLSQQSPVDIELKIIDSTPRSILEVDIEMSAMFGKMTINKHRVLFEILNRHLAARNLDELIKFEYDSHAFEVSIILSKYVEVHIEKSTGSSLLRKLNLQENNTVIDQTQKLKVDYLAHVNARDSFKVVIKEYPSFVNSVQHSKDLVINPGIYKAPSDLFSSFKYVKLSLSENSKTKLHVPEYYEVKFAKPLAEMLGFNETLFKSGNYESKYSLDLSAGITEIFIYSDLVQSHHVGDSFAPLLRIIPCMNEKEDQIVKYYDRPLYFPVRKTYIETVLIELKTSFATDITLSGGKTYVILSFRRKPIN